MRSFVAGVLFAVVLGIALCLGAVQLGLVPAAADNPKPSQLERWIARRSLHATLAREATSLKSPLEPTEANLSAGVTLYAANCAVCHGAADAKPSMPAQGFYIRAPQLAKRGVEDDPVGETFWIISHGVRFTAMPAFDGRLSSDDQWRLALFLKQMDKLPPAVDAKWKAVRSVAPLVTMEDARTSS